MGKCTIHSTAIPTLTDPTSTTPLHTQVPWPTTTHGDQVLWWANPSSASVLKGEPMWCEVLLWMWKVIGAVHEAAIFFDFETNLFTLAKSAVKKVAPSKKVVAKKAAPKKVTKKVVAKKAAPKKAGKKAGKKVVAKKAAAKKWAAHQIE